jgi:hypothetical protein
VVAVEDSVEEEVSEEGEAQEEDFALGDTEEVFVDVDVVLVAAAEVEVEVEEDFVEDVDAEEEELLG